MGAAGAALAGSALFVAGFTAVFVTVSYAVEAAGRALHARTTQVVAVGVALLAGARTEFVNRLRAAAGAGHIGI